MNSFASKFQIGKGGLTEGVLESLENHFKNKKQVRISVLKSFCRNKEEIKSLAERLKEKMPFPTKVRIIGYTIIFLKQSQKIKRKVYKP